MPVSQPQNNNKKYWIAGGMIVILAIVGFAMFKHSTPTPPQGIAVGDQNSLDIGDQDPDGVVVLDGLAVKFSMGAFAITPCGGCSTTAISAGRIRAWTPPSRTAASTIPPPYRSSPW